MAKGMNMEEFREALASDASRENEALKQQLKQLQKYSSNKIKKLEEEVERYKTMCTQLCNRCAVQTNAPMVLCMHCGFDMCEYHPTEKEINEAIEYMTKYGLPRNEDTAERLYKMLQEKRDERLKEMEETKLEE